MINMVANDHYANRSTEELNAIEVILQEEVDNCCNACRQLEAIHSLWVLRQQKLWNRGWRGSSMKMYYDALKEELKRQ